MCDFKFDWNDRRLLRKVMEYHEELIRFAFVVLLFELGVGSLRRASKVMERASIYHGSERSESLTALSVLKESMREFAKEAWANSPSDLFKAARCGHKIKLAKDEHDFCQAVRSIVLDVELVTQQELEECRLLYQRILVNWNDPPAG